MDPHINIAECLIVSFFLYIGIGTWVPPSVFSSLGIFQDINIFLLACTITLMLARWMFGSIWQRYKDKKRFKKMQRDLY